MELLKETKEHTRHGLPKRLGEIKKRDEKIGIWGYGTISPMRSTPLSLTLWAHQEAPVRLGHPTHTNSSSSY
uniref:Uncharacterized protein n=1 Tax=Oryza glumipatula TaxID=40148 RepID=A0A0E0AGJ3_9ORYZ